MSVKKIRTVMRRVRNSSKGIVWINEATKEIRLYSRIRGNEWTVSFNEFKLANGVT